MILSNTCNFCTGICIIGINVFFTDVFINNLLLKLYYYCYDIIIIITNIVGRINNYYYYCYCLIRPIR